jgi:hypothetical protein
MGDATATFTREELQAIRQRAWDEGAMQSLNLTWGRALYALADAADCLDAMIARTKVGD